MILYFNRKSCMAMALSAAMLFTSVDCMSVHAEELADMVPPVSEEEKPDDSGEGGITKEEPFDRPAVITSFQELSEEDSCIKLSGEKRALDDVLSFMPETLTANVQFAASVSENTPEDDTKPGEGETEPGEEEQPGEGETRPGEGEQPGGETEPGEGDQPGEGETQPGEGDQPEEDETEPGEGDQPGESETEPGEGDQLGGGEAQPGEGDQPGGGEAQPGEGDQPGGGDVQPGEGDQPGAEDSDGQDVPDSGNGGGENGGADDGSGSDPGEEKQDGGSNEGESQSLAPDANDAAAAAKSRTLAAEGQCWRFLVETGENSDGPVGNKGDDGNEGDSNGSDSGAEGGNGGSESGADGSTGGSGEGGTDGSTDGSEGSEGGADGSTDGSESGADGSTGGSGEGGTDGSIDGSAGGSGGSEGSTDGSESSSDGESGIEGGEGADGPETGEVENTPGIEPGEGADIPSEGNPDAVPPVKGDAVESVEIPVTWNCETYETEEADSYTFVPEWDETKWSLAESAKDTVPTIEVVYVAPESEVSTEEELAAAFAAGYSQITLTEDIFLTKPLYLPVEADITLDGCGYSLLRGKVTVEGEETQSPETFSGVMIAMDGEGYTEDTYGTLTLKDITVNGGTEVDRAGAPAIMDRGNLILDEGAVVRNNYNYGTYPKEGEEEKETVPDYGGGIQVYGELTLSPEALVTENFADEFGGGIYLAEGAVLNLYADVIVANSVGEGHGYGADLYAAPGSVIYYDPSVDMEREGFYICEGTILIPMGIAQIDLPVDGKKEVYISVSEDSGYSDEDVAALKAGLEALGYTIITNRRTDIDTTDLRNWYVYDHYDTDATCWGEGTTADPPQKWLDVYGGGEKRKFYPWKETQKKNVKNPASTIEEWLGRLGNKIEADNYMGNRYILDQVEGIAPVLSNFKEHIYTRNEDGCPTMTFVGYGWPAYVDFLFYDPESDGEKVVDFDVDSSDIFTHTMVGSGFLVNTGVNDKNQLSGYLVYYAYAGAEYPKDPTNTKARSVTIYRMDGVDADKLHGVGADVNKYEIGKGDFYYINSKTRPAEIEGFEGFTEIVRKDITEWDDQMSVQIKTAPDRIEVRQQPKSASKDISECKPILDVQLSELSGYSGFGPLVAYTHVGHICMMASGFTFSNLRMYFTDPELEQKDMLNPLEEADFTQEGTQKYFINLFGDSDLAYNETANFGQYQEYMKMMQKEGIVLITDRETPFDPYLGDPDDQYSNLVELKDGGKLSVDELIEKIKDSIADDRTTTRLDDKLANPPGAGGLTEANPGQSVGNIWLQAGGGQVRETLQGAAFSWSGYEIRIVDDITYYHGDPSGLTVSYDVLKPGKTGYTHLGTAKPSEGASFTVTKDTKEWPSGRYIVRQTVSGSAIHGYAYFDLDQPTTPVGPPVTYPVRVNVTARKNGGIWNDSGRLFKLRPSGGGDLIDPASGPVPAGKYVVCDVTESEEGEDTGIPVPVANADKADTEIIVYVDYYTVTFHDGDATLAEKTLLKGQEISRPEEDPSKPDGRFREWVTEDKGSTAYVFGAAAEHETHIYAGWTYPVTVKVSALKDGEGWSDNGRHFMLLPQGGTELAELSEPMYAGTYAVYDVTGLSEGASPTEDMDTGVPVTVEDADEPGTDITVTVAYFTVTFYDEKTENPKLCESGAEPNPQIVLKDRKAGRPGYIPEKDKYEFTGWVVADGTAFDFDSKVDEPKQIFASWKKIVEPRYTVTVNPRKDGAGWKSSGRIFALRPEGGDGETVFDMAQVKKGTYRVFDITGGSSAAYRARAAEADLNVTVDDGDTGVTVTVENKDETAAVDYYTVTFYDGSAAYGMDTPQKPVIVLKGKKVAKPETPDKAGYIFTGWKTGEDGSTPHDFEQAVTQKTNIYAGWTPMPIYTITAKAGKGGQISPAGAVSINEGGERAFTITPNKGYRIKTVKADETDVTDSVTGTDNSYTFRDVRADHTITASFAVNKKTGVAKEPERTPDDGGGEEMQTVTVWQEAVPNAENDQTDDMTEPGGKEPKTADPTPIEIYATIAMIAGLTYLLLYFMEEGRGMTEREKEVFVAAFIRWAKKGGRFRRYCAVVIIFCLLVYYHSIGKRTGRNALDREYLKQAL